MDSNIFSVCHCFQHRAIIQSLFSKCLLCLCFGHSKENLQRCFFETMKDCPLDIDSWSGCSSVLATNTFEHLYDDTNPPSYNPRN